MLKPSFQYLSSIIHNCTRERNLRRALFLLTHIHERGVSGNTFLLLPLLLEFEIMGALIPVLYRNKQMRDSLVIDLIKRGNLKHALTLYLKMRDDDSSLDENTLISLMRACTEMKDSAAAVKLHADVSNTSSLPLFGNLLINMCAKCGLLEKAQEVFDQLPLRDAISWNTLIAGYCRDKGGEQALHCLDLMKIEGISPDAVTYVSSLKACSNIEAADKRAEIHMNIERKGLSENIIVGNALVDMYARCGCIMTAYNMFENLRIRDIISWNTIIAGYVRHEQGAKALNCLELMQLEGFLPNVVTHVCILKACGLIGDISEAKKTHENIIRNGFIESNLIVGNALVDMYAKLGLLEKAQEVFDVLRVRDINSWNALISGYADLERGNEALYYFYQMQLTEVPPDVITYISVLKACGSIGAVKVGIEIHEDLLKRGLLHGNLLLGSTLIDMYVKFEWFLKAQEVFDFFPIHDVILWNTLIGGYATHNCENVLDRFDQMKLEGLSPNSVTFVHILKACGDTGNVEKGMEIHQEIVKKGFFKDHSSGNALVSMYAKCWMLAEAQETFDGLLVRDTVSWTALMTGYIKQNRGSEGLQCIEQMHIEGNSPDRITMASSLNVCSKVRAEKKGEEIFSESSNYGILDKDNIVGCALVDMHIKCGSLSKAQEVFDKILVRDTISWNALISGYAEHSHANEALNCFEHMQMEGVSPDITTFVCTLKILGEIGVLESGQAVHAQIAEKGLLKEDTLLGNALIEMYAKCGLLTEALELFNELSFKTTISWNALIAGYAKHEFYYEVLNFLEIMEMEGFSPDNVTFLYCLKACGLIAAENKGSEIHTEISKRGLSENITIGNALVDMYAKCGSLLKAQQVFQQLPSRDIVSWNSLISGFAQIGEPRNVFVSFDGMRLEGQRPDPITFLSVLNACSHLGLTEKGSLYFECMSKEFGIVPTLEHHTCMIDLLGHIGCIDEAVSVIQKLPFPPDLSLWHSVLAACSKLGNLKLGRMVFDNTFTTGMLRGGSL